MKTSIIRFWESIHQQRHLQIRSVEIHSKSRIFHVFKHMVYMISVISSLIIVLVELIDSTFSLSINDLPASFFIFQLIVLYLLPVYVLIPTTILLYVGLLIKTLVLSVESITREKLTGSWDILLLSHVNASELIYGKMFATFQTTFRKYLLLGLFRTGIVMWLGLTMMSRMNLNILPSTFEQELIGPKLTVEPHYLLIVCIAIPVMTILNGLFTIIVGILAGLFLKRGNLWAAWGLRATILIGAFALFSIGASLYFQHFEPKIYVNDASGAPIETSDPMYIGTPSWKVGNFLMQTGVSFLDNGININSALISYAAIRLGQHNFLLAILLGVFASYTVLIIILLRCTIILANRQGI